MHSTGPTKCAMHLASKTTLQKSANQKLRINEEPYAERAIKEATKDDLIAHVTFNPETDTYTLSNGHEEEEKAILIPFSSHPDPRQVNVCRTSFRIYSNSYATKCPGEPKYIQNMRLLEGSMDFLLLQKHFTCFTESLYLQVHWCWVLVCTHWAAAINWELEKCCMFIIGCPNIIVIIDCPTINRSICKQMP